MFGNRLKALRKSLNYTQKELGEKLNISARVVGYYEANERFPDKYTLNRIADLFNVSTDYLLGRTDIESPVSSSNKETLNVKDEKDIEKALNTALEQLEHSQEGLMFSGEPLDDETRELLKISLENSMRLAKQIAKNKFTPKKYK